MDLDLQGFDNRVNCRRESPVPDSCRTEPCCLGIDEAGRGPVLGPMVYGICYCPLSKYSTLNSMGFADSKTLNEDQRDALFAKLNESGDVIGWIVDILVPNYISNGMLARCKYNLNQISHDTAIGLIRRALNHGVNVTEVFVDTVGDPNSYQAKLKGQFPNIAITVAKKADSTYPIVSAASICAKVTRDKAVKEWKFIEGGQQVESNYGSGYPSDPKTKQYLANTLDRIFGYTQFVRFSWSTASIILDDKAVAVQWEDDDDGVSKKKVDIKSVSEITSFFQSSKSDTSTTPVTKTHRFFTERALKTTVDI
jgi:ribonuclease H2 subunit A